MSGSGLAQFFRDFLPKGDSSYKYETSLVETSIDPEAPMGIVEDHDELELECDYEYTPQEFSFPEWRKFQKESLTIYMQKRIAPQEANNEGDSSYDSEASSDYQSDVEVDEGSEYQSNSEDGEEEEDARVWDTQQQQQRLEGSPAKPPAVAAASKEKRKRIPHVTQAIHSVTRMQHIDMYTKDLSLPLCRVARISKLRTTKRCLYHPSAAASQRCPVFPGRMPRVPFLPKEEDGPLSSCFKHVISLELVPLEADSSTNTNSSSTATNTKTKNRLRVFFYNQYAQSLQQWIDKLSGPNAISKANPLLMSLHHLPAICIVPFALDPHDWYDQQYSLEYCLCIGDVSSLKVAHTSTSAPSAQHDHYRHVRLDANDNDNGNGADTYSRMEIRATTVSSSNTEVILSKQRLESGVTLVSPTSFVASGYQEWQKERQEIIAKRANEDGDDEEQQPLATPTETAAAEPSTATQVEQVRQSEETADKARDVPKTTAGTVLDKDGGSSVGGVAGSIDGGIGEERPSSAAQQPATAVRNRIRALELTTVMDAPPKRPRLDPSAIYLSLADRRVMYTRPNMGKTGKVNVYGVVVGFQAPRITKRGDWMITASLIDKSLPMPGQEATGLPVTLVVFCKERNQLPQLVTMGDVLRMHRVSLQEWKGDIQLVGNKPSSYVVVRNTGDHWDVLSTANSTFTFTSSDETQAKELWNWAQERLGSHSTINAEHRFTLASIVANEDNGHLKDQDLTVMVTAKFPFPLNARSAVMPRGFLRVWDGTGASTTDPLPIATAMAQQSVRNGDPPCSAVVKIASVVKKIRELDDNESLEAPKALCGRVVNLIIWEDALWDMVKSNIQIGTFLRLRNVDYQMWREGNMKGLSVHAKSWLTPVPDTTFEVRILLDEHHNRILRKDPYIPGSGFLPLEGEVPPTAPDLFVTSPQRGIVPVRDADPQQGLAWFCSKNMLSKFVGDACVIDTIPKLEGSLKSLCKPSPDGKRFFYRFAVKLQDQTGELNAIVDDNVGAKLLGMPAAQAVSTKVNRSNQFFDDQVQWRATLQSLEWKGAAYFVLMDISKA